MAVITSAVVVVGSAIIWLVPGFNPLFYVVFLFMGAALGGVDLCVYPMLLELCDSNSVGRYSGYYYTVSMAAQVVTPILSGMVMDAAPTMLFGYITLMGAFMLLTVLAAKHGDTILIDEVARVRRRTSKNSRRESGCRRAPLESRACRELVRAEALARQDFLRAKNGETVTKEMLKAPS